jgi:ribonuclease E
MTNRKILINAVDAEECRIANVLESKLEDFQIESAMREITHGNIYKGIVTRVEPSLEAAFVDYGAERHGFLQGHEIHSDYFQENHASDRSIKHKIVKGQELLLQVTKDPVGNKGAMLTTFISLAGRYVVLMPGSKNRGISRKLEAEGERQKIRELIESLKLPDEFGLIIRTAGISCTKSVISKDLQYLLKLWKTIKEKAISESAPALLHKEMNLSVRSIRDYLTPDVTEILIDDETIYKEVKDFVYLVASKSAKIVKLYKGDKPIFSKYQLEEQIASIYENRVKLKSGGSIVIEPTEAMVSIDVNSGKMIHQKSIELTALETNLEATDEIARQLRLRDLGGLIVLDFIDMKEGKHKLEVERALKNHLKKDKARVKVGRISQFGLLEMSRQRIRPSIEFGSYEPCRHCRGRGITPSKESLSLAFLRKLRVETLREGEPRITAIVPPVVADFLLNNKRKDIAEMELRRNVSIRIGSNPDMVPGDCEVKRE